MREGGNQQSHAQEYFRCSDAVVLLAAAAAAAAVHRRQAGPRQLAQCVRGRQSPMPRQLRAGDLRQRVQK